MHIIVPGSGSYVVHVEEELKTTFRCKYHDRELFVPKTHCTELPKAEWECWLNIPAYHELREVYVDSNGGNINYQYSPAHVHEIEWGPFPN